MSKVWAGAAHEMHGFLDWVFRQALPDTAEPAYLERWASIWGIFRKPAAPAAGEAIFAGTDGAIIPAQTLVQNQTTEVRYVVQADCTIADGEAALRVIAVTPGKATNMAAGDELSLLAPIAGVRSAGVVGAGGLSGGSDEEGDESLRARLLNRLRLPPRGGSKNDWETWAKEVPGVTRAWCYPLGDGIGTVSLTFVCDDLADPIPSAEMVARVREHIEPLRPASVKEYTIFAPELFPVDLRLSVAPDSQAVREAVLAEIGDVFAKDGAPGGTLLRSHLTEAISLAAGEFDHVLIAPAGNVPVPAGYFACLGEVVWEAHNV
jgi:uncharacterized phage protein gp47/JayE